MAEKKPEKFLDLDAIPEETLIISLAGQRVELALPEFGVLEQILDLKEAADAKAVAAGLAPNADGAVGYDELQTMIKIIAPNMPEELRKKLTGNKAAGLIEFWRGSAEEREAADREEAAEVAKDPTPPA